MARKIFIPIKAESERVPNKNFREFCGKPLWKHTLDKLTGYKVFVNTDSKELIDQLNDTYTNVTTIHRASSHLGHKVSVNKILRHFVNKCAGDDIIAQVHVTSPFLKIETLHKMFEMFKNNSIDSIATVDIIQARCWRTESPKRFIPLNHDPELLEQTQNINPVCVENSLVYMFNASNFNCTRNRLSGRKLFYETSFPENLDIDTEADWEMCKQLSEIYK